MRKSELGPSDHKLAGGEKTATEEGFQMLRRALVIFGLMCFVCTNAMGADVFEDYLHLDFPAADGFDFPMGDPDAHGCYVSNKKKFCGWYVSVAFGQKYSLGIHPGEDWNGKGGGNTDDGQPVFAVANGRVIYARDADEPWCKIAWLANILKSRLGRFGLVGSTLLFRFCCIGSHERRVYGCPSPDLLFGHLGFPRKA